MGPRRTPVRRGPGLHPAARAAGVSRSRRRGYRTLMVMALLSLLVIGELERTHLTL